MVSSLICWDVDTQVDFMRREGRLYVPGCERVVPRLAQLTAWAAHIDVRVIASACAHKPGDEEFAQFPPHCLVGTPGQHKIPETLLPDRIVIPNHSTDLPEALASFGQIILQKQCFDVFTNPNTDSVLSRLGLGAGTRVLLYGVVTEICVISAARGLLKRGFEVLVVEDAVFSLDPAKGRAALEEIGARGGWRISVDAALALRLPPAAAA